MRRDDTPSKRNKATKRVAGGAWTKFEKGGGKKYRGSL